MTRPWTGTAAKVEHQVWPSGASRFFCVSGFTLVEVVLAMALLGLVVGSMSIILAGSLRRHSGNEQKWSLLLAAQRTLEDEVVRLGSNQRLFEDQLGRGTWRQKSKSGNAEITVVCRSVGDHLLRVEVTARGSGKRVVLETIVGDRWPSAAGSVGKKAGRHTGKGH